MKDNAFDVFTVSGTWSVDFHTYCIRADIIPENLDMLISVISFVCMVEGKGMTNLVEIKSCDLVYAILRILIPRG